MLWMRVWSPEGAVTGCSTAMADGLLPLCVAVLEDLGDVMPALLHAQQAEAEVRDDVAHEVVRVLALRGEQQDVSSARQAVAAVDNVHPARVQRLTHRARAVRVLVAVGDLDREGGRGLREVRGG